MKSLLIRFILLQAKSTVAVPVFFNGSIFSLADADSMVARTGVDGVMSARGLMANPALFAGHTATPLSALARFCRYSFNYGSNFFIFHHHLAYMMEDALSAVERRSFNALSSYAGVVDWLTEKFGPSWRDTDRGLRRGSP
jgi:tRNA-dihydrouridine synthase 4